GCVAGYCPFIGRWMSLSRTIVFFPYFWMGLICDPAYDWNKMRKYGMIAFGLAVLLGCHMAPRILASFLYQAGWYGGQAEKGWLRLGCYAIGFGIGCFLLCMIPDRRYFCTKMGADTLPIYLVHAPVVGVLREIPLPWYVELLLSAYLSYFIWKCTQWKGKICGIRSGICTKERRRYRWRHFRTFMKHTENPCIDSFSP
ncbi:MAG: hypothetical protein IJV50_03440, partial [Lachnospiraceae bacterium]|nr:hypothetical protein [Lachnospiraceae bacterium]